MSRIEDRFTQLRESGRRALIPYITAGDPRPEATAPLMHALVAGGADIVELGVPFSDPMADGPVIQRASERALAAGMTLARVLETVREFRMDDPNTPVVLMGYLNPFEIAGYGSFAKAASSAGVDGILTVDLPPEEAAEFHQAISAEGMDLIFLLAPTSSEARIERVVSLASGFVYYVSLKGVTGASHLDVDSVARKVRSIKAKTDLPVGVGFGIRDAHSAAAISAVSDAVVAGSVLVGRVESLRDTPERIADELGGIMREMRAAMDTESGARL